MATKPDQRVALLAIRPEFVEAIFAGRKEVEFRRRSLAPDIDLVVIYETQPTSAIVGTFEVHQQIDGSPDAIWRRFRKVAGIRRRSYFQYFTGTDRAVAIQLSNPVRFARPVSLTDVGPAGIAVPQSYRYLDRSTVGPNRLLVRSIDTAVRTKRIRAGLCAGRDPHDLVLASLAGT